MSKYNIFQNIKININSLILKSKISNQETAIILKFWGNLKNLFDKLGVLDTLQTIFMAEN